MGSAQQNHGSVSRGGRRRSGRNLSGGGAADITLKSGIERLIKEEIPEVVEVLDTTDHSSGTNPYYQAGKA